MQVQQNQPETALRLYLQAAEAMNQVPENQGMEELGYEFISQALTIQQDDLSDSESKQQAINLIVATLHTITMFGQENSDALISNTASFCQKLLKKNEQCQAITVASSLYYSSARKDGNKVMDQLKRALKIADVCMNQPKNMGLVVTLLNKYLYFYSLQVSFMSAEDINNLGDLIKEHIDQIDDQEVIKDALKYLENTKAAVELKGAEDARYKDLNLP